MEEYFTKKYSGLEQWTTLSSLGCCPSTCCPWTRWNSITLEVSAPWGQGSCVVLPTVWSEHFSQNLWIRWFSINISWTIIIALSHYGELSTTSTHYHFPEWSSRRILNNLKSYYVTLNMHVSPSPLWKRNGLRTQIIIYFSIILSIFIAKCKQKFFLENLLTLWINEEMNEWMIASTQNVALHELATYLS